MSWSSQTEKINRQTIIWRPCIVHASNGITPVSLPFTPSLPEEGVIDPEKLGVPARAVWGDVDKLGTIPKVDGWRVSLDSPVGFRLLISLPIPADWTHVKCYKFEGIEVEDPVSGAPVERLMGYARAYNDKKDELFTLVQEAGLSNIEGSPWGTSEVAVKRYAEIFDRDRYDDNFRELAKQIPEEKHVQVTEKPVTTNVVLTSEPASTETPSTTSVVEEHSTTN